MCGNVSGGEIGGSLWSLPSVSVGRLCVPLRDGCGVARWVVSGWEGTWALDRVHPEDCKGSPRIQRGDWLGQIVIRLG